MCSCPTTGLGKSLGVQVVDVSRIARQSAHEDGKLLVLWTGRLYPQERPCYSFLLEVESPQGNTADGRIMSMKSFMMPSGI
jgi:hypothetical protein